MGSLHQTLLSPTTPPSPKSQTKESQEIVQRKRSRRMAAMAVANYKRRMQQKHQVSLQESQDQASTNFNHQQSTQSSVPDQGCFSSARPMTNFEGDSNPNGTKK